MDFFKFLLQSDNELLVSEMQKIGVTDFISELKHVENCTDLKKLAQTIQDGLPGFIVENIKGKSTKANDVSYILWRWVCWINNSNYCQHFHKA